MTAPEKRQDEALTAEELRDGWLLFSPEDRLLGFGSLPRSEREEFFFDLSSREQAEILLSLKPEQRRSWMRLLPPDDAADLIQEGPEEERDGLLGLLDDATRTQVAVLLAYKADEAGGLMNPRFARVRPEMTVDEAISYLRKQARERLETLYYAYALDEQQRLLGVVTFRDLFAAPPDKRVRDVMVGEVVTVSDQLDQEAVSRVFADHDFAALPVVDGQGRMQGIVTADDIVDVVEEEATEDMQKMGGMEALDAPYLEVGLAAMVRKRGVWLSALFLGEMLTATAMAFFEEEIARAVVLAVFLPLIISSGGNSGSQATTLVIRAMALGQVKLRDWWRVVRRELLAGAALGVLLGVMGFARIAFWQRVSGAYGEHWMAVGLTVSASLVGVVMFGTTMGSLFPFVLRRVGLDPASASAPFVATFVDVTGLLIYFAAASVMLRGSLL